MNHNSWYPWLQEEFRQDYFRKLAAFVHEAYETTTVYPPKVQVFSAFENTDYPDIKVVILGQDPYPRPKQAHGMCFSVNPGIPLPPSLQNIFKELHAELNVPMPDNGYLMPWARQGVFLLNTVLTVQEGKPLSHAGRGWETFTDHAIQKINEADRPIVFLLWGRNARAKEGMIDHQKHLVLCAPHPSPLSANYGFFGCGHFARTNAYLKENGLEPISWELPHVEVYRRR